MVEERYHATTQNGFYPDMFNVNKNITVEAKLISPPTYCYRLKEFCIKLVIEKQVCITCTLVLLGKKDYDWHCPLELNQYLSKHNRIVCTI